MAINEVMTDMYAPDRWVVLNIKTPVLEYQRLLVGYYGGYAYGDSWRMNSGITKIVEGEDYFEFHGHSGSVYVCRKNEYGMSGLMMSTYEMLVRGGVDQNISVTLADGFEPQ